MNIDYEWGIVAKDFLMCISRLHVNSIAALCEKWGIRGSACRSSICGALTVATLAFVAPTWSLASTSAGAQANTWNYQVNPAAWQFRLTVEQGSYVVGADPNIMLTVANRSNEYQPLPHLALWEITRLEITNRYGTIVSPVSSPHVGWKMHTGVMTISIPPNEALDKHWGAQVYLPLSYWGYRLSAPGDYAITGRLKLADRKTTVTSNVVHVQIRQ